MDPPRIATSCTPSKASTVVRDSIEIVQPATPSAPPTVQGVYATPPRNIPSRPNGQHPASSSQNSMQHVITIEHGKDLRSKASIHENMLCEYSQKLQRFSERAEAQRERYNTCDDILDLLGFITMMDWTPDQYEEQKLGAKLVSTVLDLDKSFPLQDYERPMRKIIRQVLGLQFTNKNLVQMSDRPKTLKAFSDLDLSKQLHLLNCEGALEVAEEVCSQLQRFRAKEVQKAKTNINKAWAQGRLLLRDANEKSVTSLVEWAYRNALIYDDAEHLYDLWMLATRLEFVILAEECMERLFQNASKSICSTLSIGRSLRHLLGLSKEHDAPDSTTQSDDVVTVVFRHVLKDESPPEKLSQLVVDAMAKAMDSDTWSQLQHTVNHNIACRLIAAMVTYKELKSEQGINGSMIIKSEDFLPRESVQPAMIEAHHCPRTIG